MMIAPCSLQRSLQQKTLVSLMAARAVETSPTGLAARRSHWLKRAVPADSTACKIDEESVTGFDGIWYCSSASSS
jgi:hypothetical protein